MRHGMINEDSNQFGPGTDLVICLLALLMVFVLIVSFLYGTEKKSAESAREDANKYGALANNTQNNINALQGQLDECKKRGEFKPAGEFLVAGTFEQNPYYALKNPAATEAEIQKILAKYKDSGDEFPYIFIIGHANEVGIKGEPDLSYEDLLKRNWEFAGARAAVIANLLQRDLSDEAKNKIVIVSTGQFDLRDPEDPDSPENAFVEVFFGNEWKLEKYKQTGDN